jgi:TolB-like protein/DNA-binding winged helix-turn-helix (wHTH) protein/tetratricopeptide (TPR) repeat protein
VSQQTNHAYEFGPFQLVPEERLLRCNGGAVALSPKDMDLLLVLVESRGRLLQKDELMKHLWPESFVEEANLSHHVFMVRKALNDHEDGVIYIETVPKHGYRFVVPVRQVREEEEAATIARRQSSSSGDGHADENLLQIPDRLTSDSERKLGISSKPASQETLANQESLARRRRLTGTVALSLLAVLLAALAMTFIPTQGRRWGSQKQRLTTLPAIQSLAVLPLANLTGDPEQEYFVDGMTEALISQLGKIGALRVISRTSAMHYKGSRKRLPEIAKELDIQAVLEGSVQRSGNQVRITVQLIEAMSDRHLWSDSYDGEMDKVLTLQSKVAADVAEEIKIAVTREQRSRLTETRPVDPEAYEAFLLGHHHMRKRTSEGLGNALKFFQRAVEKDPNYAPAYAGLADVYDLMCGYLLLAPREAYPKARAAAIAALKIDNQLAEAHVALAKIKARYDLDWEEARKEFLRGIELNPSYAEGHAWYGQFYLGATGQHDKAIAESEHARRLDPLSLSINLNLGTSLWWADKHDRAIEQMHRTLEIDPNFSLGHSILGQIYVSKGLFEDAIEELQKAVKYSKGELVTAYLANLGYAYAASGRQPEARKALDSLLQLSRKQYVPAISIAEVYAGLGDKAQALEWLEQAYEERSRIFFVLKVDPTWDSLREEPKFQDLVRRIGLNP